jgi:hypothetical protein
MSQVNFFPYAYPDESLFSLISRYHQLSGNLDDRATLTELFGKHTLIVTSHLPSLIDIFTSNIPTGAGVDSQMVIDRYTVFPYYRPFLSERQHLNAIAMMKGGSANGLKTMMGIVPSQTRSSNNCYRFCAECVIHDAEQYGQAYWHRAHQLPLVWICHEHRIQLYELDPRWVSLNRHRLFLPTDSEVIGCSKKISVEPLHLGLLTDIGTHSKALLDANLGTICQRKLRLAYLQMAAKFDLVNANGRLRIRNLSSAIERRILKLPDLDDFKFLRSNSSGIHDWATGLLRKPRKSAHPLKHLFLICSLNGDLKTITNVSSTERKINISKETIPSLPLNALDLQLRELLIEDKKSLRQCSQILNLSVTTLRVEATRLKIEISVRPKALKESQLIVLRRALLTTASLKSISQTHLVSVVSLYRILRMYPEVALERDKLIFEMEKSKRREQFLVGAKEQFARHLPEYIWLYRHDRAWLTQTIKLLPQRVLSAKSRVDWESRDVRLAKEIQKYSKQLYASPRPVHVTKAALARGLQALSMIDKKLTKLPLTSMALNDAIETREQFQCRRLEWAAQHILKQQCHVPKWLLLRVAGLRSNISGTVLLMVNNLTRYR